MASQIDVIMAQYERDAAEEERKMQERIEKSKTIRALDDITAMAETAEMGYNIGTTVSSLTKSFKTRKGMKDAWIKKHGKESWRSGGADGSQSGRNRRRHFLRNNNMVVGQDLTQDKLISMYMQGTNITTTHITPNGQVITGDDKDKSPVNVQQYGVQPTPAGTGLGGSQTKWGGGHSGTYTSPTQTGTGPSTDPATTNPSGTYESKHLNPEPDSNKAGSWVSWIGDPTRAQSSDGTPVPDPLVGKGWANIREIGPEADWWLGKNIQERRKKRKEKKNK